MYNSVSFGSIYSHYRNDTYQKYQRAFETKPQEHQLKPYATRIFRELPTQLAVAKIIDSTRPATIRILGCSDGSEAYAYAIALAEENKGKSKITAVDKEPFLIEMARTGHIVCADIEKEWSNNHQLQKGSPLAGSGWNKYLNKTDEPDNFKKLCEEYPILSQITSDKVAGISIGKGMDWYKVNQENLPKIDFVQGDMRDHLEPKDGNEQQIYVVSNSLGYLALDDPKEFLKVFVNIQNKNYKNDSVYVVLGDVEHQIFRQLPQARNVVSILGFEPIDKQELKNKGVLEPDVASKNIWKLRTSSHPINLSCS